MHGWLGNTCDGLRAQWHTRTSGVPYVAVLIHKDGNLELCLHAQGFYNQSRMGAGGSHASHPLAPNPLLQALPK